jgi:hypothetical protein
MIDNWPTLDNNTTPVQSLIGSTSNAILTLPYNSDTATIQWHHTITLPDNTSHTVLIMLPTIQWHHTITLPDNATIQFKLYHTIPTKQFCSDSTIPYQTKNNEDPLKWSKSFQCNTIMCNTKCELQNKLLNCLTFAGMWILDCGTAKF